MQSEYHQYMEVYKEINPLSSGEDKKFKNANIRHIYDKRLLNSDIIVEDHCHITGAYHGTAHSNQDIESGKQNSLNLKFQTSFRFLPCSLEELSEVLTQQSVSNEDYEIFKIVWIIFNCITLGDYSDI